MSMSQSIKEIIKKENFVFNSDGIPLELQKYKAFCCWSKLVMTSGEIKKVPVYVKDDYLGLSKWSDRSTWMTFAEALSMLRRDDRLWGVGFIFSDDDPFVFVDFDHVDENSERFDIIETLDTWVEKSQSGKGFHAIYKGKIKKAIKSDFAEIYSEKRFIALTGCDTNDRLIKDDQIAVDMLVSLCLQQNESTGDSSSEFRERPIYSRTSEGNRNNSMFSHIWRCRRRGFTEDETRKICEEDNLEFNEPPLEDAELSEMLERNLKAFRDILEQEEKLLRRYVFIVSEGKYYDRLLRCSVTPSTIDSVHLHTNPGGRDNVPKMSRLLALNEKKQIAAFLTWIPVTHNDWIYYHDGKILCNTWNGFSILPETGGVQPWLELVTRVIPNEKQRENVISWFAYMLQYPDRKVNWQVVLCGEHGAGKDSLAAPFCKILGNAAGLASGNDIKGSYDDAFIAKKFVVINEIQNIKGDAMEILKRKCASEGNLMTLLNPKKESKILMPNLWHILINTNNHDSIKLHKNERRFYFVDYIKKSDSESNLKIFFDRYYRWLDNNGANHLLDFMLKRDLTGFDPHIIPERTDSFYATANLSKDDFEVTIDNWIETKSYSFKYDAVNIHIVKDDLFTVTGIRTSIRQVGKYLIESYNYENYNSRIAKKIDETVQFKNRSWIFHQDLKINKKRNVEVFDIISDVEIAMSKKYE